MKKIVAIFFLLTYGFTSIGATVHLHYCMNKFVGASLWQSNNNKCGKCGMTEKNNKGCCKDEHKQIKLKTEHQKSAITQYFQFIGTPALITPVAEFNFKGTAGSLTFPVSNAPPKIPRERLYILLCVFLI